jgi:hypothetical protein
VCQKASSTTMTQETISTISNVVACLTAIAALITAIATILTARQIKKQRETTYHPDLAFLKKHVYAYSSQSDLGIPTTWMEYNPEQENTATDKLSHSYTITLYNVGFGAAKNIEVSWDFPMLEMVNHVNTLAQHALQPAYHKYENGMLSLESTKFPKRTMIWKNERVGDRIGYLLPAHINKEGVALRIPFTFIHLSSCYLYFALSVERPSPPNIINLEDVPPLTVNLKFDDIAGETHRTSFDIHLELVSASPHEGTMNFDGYLEAKARVSLAVAPVEGIAKFLGDLFGGPRLTR